MTGDEWRRFRKRFIDDTRDLEAKIVQLKVAVARAKRERDEAIQVLKNIANLPECKHCVAGDIARENVK